MTLKKWLKNTVTNHTFLGFLISLLVSLITISIADFTYKITFLIIVLIATVLALGFSYFLDLTVELSNLSTVHYVAKDITITELKTHVIFDKDSESKGCLNQDSRRIRNNMDQVYSRYLVNIGTDVQDEAPKDLKIFIEDIEKPEIAQQIKIVHSKCPDLSDQPHMISNRYQFFIPINIQPKDTCKFGYEYRTKCYSSAYSCNPDFSMTAINVITESFTFNVALKDGLERKYKIVHPYKDTILQDIEVLDSSGERMYSTEHKMKTQEKMIPKFRNDNTVMEWVVEKPKVGYKYLVHFQLIAR
jgi:hypothetical protein